MRTTLIIADSLVEEARDISGIERISDLVREGLRALIAREARKRLAAFGGTDPEAAAAPRNRANLYTAENP
jgi:hypothetical protein